MRLMKSILSAVLLLSFIMPIYVNAQPSKSYKRDEKTRNKKRTGGKDFADDQAEASLVLKKFKEDLAGLDKKRLDAEASGDMEDLAKVQQKIRRVKGQMWLAKDKIEQDIIKEYNKIQEKKVRKRMKKTAKKSRRINENKREPFFKRLFRKKHR